MKLENKIVSLELARRLKELGFSHSGIYFWKVPQNPANNLKENADLSPQVHTNDSPWMLVTNYNLVKDWIEKKEWGVAAEVIPTWDVAELGEILPESFYSVKYSKGFYCQCWDNNLVKKYQMIMGDSFSTTEADARAKMICFLIEDKLI